MNTREMACHTWALSGDPKAAEGINKTYTSLTNEIGAEYQFGANLKGMTLEAIRQKTMEQLKLICQTRTEETNHIVYLCGGFREGQVCPEHLWLEDHTDTRSYDTFINQDVRRVDRVGAVGQPFQPGCEGQPFAANEIARVQLNGYTEGQLNSLRSLRKIK